MKKIKLYLTIFLFLTGVAVSEAQTSFTPGNIVVYRVGNGATTLSGNVAAVVYLDEYTPSGTLVQSIAMPTSVSGANQILTGGGGGSQEGQITLSSNGQYIIITGYGATLGTTTTTSTNPRVVGTVKYDGTVNTTTALTTISSSSPRSAVSTDGTNLWVGGSSTIGIHYTTVGSTTSTQISTAPSLGTRALSIVGGQLYASTNGGTPRFGTIGGNPISSTPGQTYTGLPGISTTGNFNQFVLFDMNNAISGVDVLYIADEAAGIRKYSFDGTNWNLNSTIGTSTDVYTGLTATISGTTVVLYATRKGNNSSTIRGGQIVSLTDNSGYNGSFSVTPNIMVDLNAISSVTYPVNSYSFHGLAFAPQAPSLKVSVKIFLQGAYSGSGLHKDVNSTWASILNASALSQPYNVAPFNYTGTETVSSGFFTSNVATTDIMDWVLVELRDATTPSTVIATRAAFVREDGKVVDLDGSSDVSFPGVANGSYYIVIKHRNHLGVRSATAVSLNSSPATTYDFSSSQSQAFQDAAITPTNDAMKDLGGGVFGLWAGNANGNTNVRFTGLNNDAGIILSALGGNQAILLSSTYNSGDLNLDGTVRYTGLNNDAGVLLGVLGSNQAAIYTQHQ
jgi:hypothetical protein